LVRDSLHIPSRGGGEAHIVSKRKLTALRSANRPRSSTFQNQLLAALPERDRDRLRPMLRLIPLKLKTMLHKPGETIRQVYFPGGGFCSIVTVLQNGNMIEVATVGREGMVGVTALSDGTSPTSATMVQGEADLCYEMTVDAFRQEMNGRGAFHDIITRYIEAHIGVVMQSTACNAVHSVEERLARWLLMAHDRMGVDEFPLTQEFAAMMLGAARPTVSLTASTLQRAGLIRYRRGHVTVVDRTQLESASCECYGTATALLKAVTAGNLSRRAV
jgi:CRP-like cAMP-binding protein